MFSFQFWFACEGLKRQWTDDPDKAVQIIHLIHRKYIRPRKINVSELIRREVNDRVANKSTLDVHIFDAAQKEVEDLMRDSVYANFLNSDVYLSYIQVSFHRCLSILRDDLQTRLDLATDSFILKSFEFIENILMVPIFPLLISTVNQMKRISCY